jgi:hypothetical protein
MDANGGASPRLTPRGQAEAEPPSTFEAKLFFHPSSRSGQDSRATMVYTHVLNRGGRGVRSPLDK